MIMISSLGLRGWRTELMTDRNLFVLLVLQTGLGCRRRDNVVSTERSLITE